MNIREKAIKGVIWTAIQNWGSQVISFAVFLLLARLLEPTVFGLMALTSVFFAFMGVFLDQGFSAAIIQRQKLDQEHLDTAFWTNIGIGMLLIGISFTAAGPIATIFKQPLLAPIIRWLSLSFLFGTLCSVQNAILSRKLAFKLLAIRTLIATLAGGVVGVAMALSGFGVWSLVGQQITNGIFGVLVLWWTTDWRPGFKVSLRHFKELFSYGINVVGISMLNFLNRRSDDLLIGYFLGPVALGYYTIAYRILLVITQLLIGTIHKTAMPIFSRLQQEPERLRQAFYSAIQLTSLIAFPIFLSMSALAPEIIIVVFGERWSPSIPVMQILSLIGLLYAGFYYNGPVIMALGKPSWNLGLNCLQAVGNVVVFSIAVRWGIVAVAASYVIRGYLMSPIAIWAVHKLLRIKLATYFSQYAAPLAGSLVMVVTILVAKHFLGGIVNLHILLAVCITLGAIVYVATIMWIAPKLAQRTIELLRLALPQSMWKKT